MHHSDPHSDNLFSRLFSYTPRTESREPIEDFCTESLAWCLRKSPAFAQKFLEKCNVRLEFNARSLDIHTQNRFCDHETQNAGRFDLVIESRQQPKFVLVIESKVDADFRQNQLPDYKRQLTSNDYGNIPLDNRYLATITRLGKANFGTSADLKWCEVQLLLASTANSEPSKHVAETMTQFAGFLKHRKLAPLELMNTTPTLLRQWSPVKLLEEQLTAIVERFRQKPEIRQLIGRHQVQTRFNKWIDVTDGGEFYAGFGIAQIEAEWELFMWIEIALSGNRLDLVKILPRELTAWFKSASRHILHLKEENYANSKEWDEAASTTHFAFSKTIDHTADGEAVLDLLYETTKMVLNFQRQA